MHPEGVSENGIPNFFRNQCVFLTGSTGFLGKAIVEKLLRCCPEVSKIFVLVRAPTRKDTQGRLNNLLECDLFTKIRVENPHVLNKIVAIKGDLSFPSLGISEDDRQILKSQVSIVIHSGATIKFNEQIKTAFNINVGGTLRLVQLAKEMSHLKAFVHVSTAFANCDKKTVEEIVYEIASDPYKVIECVELMDEKMSDYVTPFVIGQKPNTYTFTKALAEQLLTVEGHDLPICIVRPAIVSAAEKEPMPGWIDNYSGCTGLVAAVGKGVLQILPMDPNKVSDIIPLDYVVNLIIASAWYTSLSKANHFNVYHSWSGGVNPLLCGDLKDMIVTSHRQHPPSGVVMYPSLVYKKNKWIWNVSDFLLHVVPAFLLDQCAIVVGVKPRMMKTCQKISKVVGVQKFFLMNEWNFKTDSVLQLQLKMSSGDKEMFSCDVSKIVWPRYVENYILGIRKYLMKEEETTLAKARTHMHRVFWIQSLIIGVLCLIFGFGILRLIC